MCLFGGAVIVGWHFNIDSLKSLLPGLPTMKANTAVAFVISGVALWLIHTFERGTAPVRLGRAASLAVATLGFLTLAESLFSLDLGIDELLVTDRAGFASFPGRMSPVTALNFLLIGLSLFALKAPQGYLAATANWLAAGPLFLAALTLVGFAYGVISLYQLGPFNSIALPTALSFFVLALSVLAANPSRGIGFLFVSDTAGGVVTRRLLPTVPFALFVLGWLRLTGQQAGYYDTAFGLALMVVVNILVSVFAISSTALTLQKVDLKRKGAEAAVVALNIGLERRVEERTRELEKVSADLKVANIALEQLSLHDSLTNIANRRFFDAYLAGQLALARRHGRSISLVLCDVDDFKTYNDHYGHQAGDECLRRVAAAIQSCCRRPGDLAARYGGEEFAMILPDTDSTGATQTAEAARNAVAQLKIPHALSLAGPYVSISGGLSTFMGSGDTAAEQLVSESDQNLFLAKRLGRNQIVARQMQPQKAALRVG